MKCVIIYDEPNAIRLFEKFVNMTQLLELVDTFIDSIEAFHFLQENEIDLVFIDINMPDLSGIQIIKSIKNN